MYDVIIIITNSLVGHATRILEVQCDPIKGLCTIPDFEVAEESIDLKEGEEITYVGDQICNWCWGISPKLNALQR